MGLSMNERRALEEIDRRLTAADPRLAARLGTLSPAPLRPTAVRAALWRRRGAVLGWLGVALAVTLFLLAGALHAAILTGVGLALLLTAGVAAWCRWARQPPDARRRGD